MGAEQHRPAALLVRGKLLLIGRWVCLLDGAALAAAAGAQNTNTAATSLSCSRFTHRPWGSNGGVVQFDSHCCRSFLSLCVAARESLSLAGVKLVGYRSHGEEVSRHYFQNKRHFHVKLKSDVTENVNVTYMVTYASQC